jgi:hypothetical protein
VLRIGVHGFVSGDWIVGCSQGTANDRKLQLKSVRLERC